MMCCHLVRAVVLLLLSAPAVAAPPVLPSSEELGLYYTLGGTRAVPANPGRTLRLKLLPDIQVGANYSCGKFDHRLQVEQILQRLEDQVMALTALPEQFLLALPGGLFCRAFPGACQLMQYYSVRAGDAFELALNSCQEMERIMADRGPASPWTQVAKSLEWGRQAGQGGNVIEAQKAAEEVARKGLVWVGGRRAGGVGQELIRPVYDSTRAGWCLLNQESVNCRETDRETPSAVLFETPEDAANWLVDIVGEQAISLIDGAPSPSIPGHGLLPLIETERERIETVLNRLVRTDPIEINAEDLADISSQHLVMRREIIDGLQARAHAGWRIQRLASELAAARVIEKTFIARAALQAGRQEPNVAALKPAQETLAQTLNTLNGQVDFVLREVQESHRLASQTIRTFIEYEALSGALKPIRVTPEDATESGLVEGGFPLTQEPEER